MVLTHWIGDAQTPKSLPIAHRFEAGSGEADFDCAQRSMMPARKPFDEMPAFGRNISNSST
jgi:hypothetical protein